MNGFFFCLGVGGVFGVFFVCCIWGFVVVVCIFLGFLFDFGGL